MARETGLPAVPRLSRKPAAPAVDPDDSGLAVSLLGVNDEHQSKRPSGGIPKALQTATVADLTEKYAAVKLDAQAQATEKAVDHAEELANKIFQAGTKSIDAFVAKIQSALEQMDAGQREWDENDRAMREQLDAALVDFRKKQAKHEANLQKMQTKQEEFRKTCDQELENFNKMLHEEVKRHGALLQKESHNMQKASKASQMPAGEMIKLMQMRGLTGEDSDEDDDEE